MPCGDLANGQIVVLHAGEEVVGLEPLVRHVGDRLARSSEARRRSRIGDARDKTVERPHRLRFGEIAHFQHVECPVRMILGIGSYAFADATPPGALAFDIESNLLHAMRDSIARRTDPCKFNKCICNNFK